MRLFYGFLAGALLIGLFASGVAAQTITGSILGDVTDSSGALLPGAMVTISNDDTGTTREVATNAAGAYRFSGLAPGVFDVSVELAGFGSMTRSGVNLPIQGEVKIDFRLEVGGVTESVSVTAEAPLVQTQGTAMQTLVGNRLVRDLPLKTREFMDLALLTPGVALDQSSARNPVGTDSISFFGMDESHKAIWLDGVDFNDEVIGGGTNISSSTRTLVGQEAIQEFQVMSAGYSAEFGRSGAGAVNIVIKSGSNNLHGNAFYFLRDDAFDKAPFSVNNGIASQSGDPSPFKIQQYGGTLGGPFARDRAFYFMSVERRTNDETSQVSIPETVRTFVDGLNLGYDTRAVVPRTREQVNAVAKLTFNIGSRNRLDLTYLYDDDNDLNKDIGGSEAADRGFDDLNSSYFATASLTSLVGSRTVNEFRVNRSNQRVNRSIRADSLFLPALIFPSVNIGLDGSATPQSRNQKNWILANTTSVEFGPHTLKWGGEMNDLVASNDTNEDFNGFFEFPSDTSPFVPDRYRSGFNLQFERGESPDPTFTRVRRDMDVYSLFVNDAWRIRGNVTITAGLRYDLRVLEGDLAGPDAFGQPGFSRDRPGDVWLSVALGAAGDLGVAAWRPVPTDKLDLSPRVGFAWDLNGDGTAVVRASYGIFHDRVPTLTLRDAVNTYNGLNVKTVTVTAPDFFPTQPDLSSFPTDAVNFSSVPSPQADTPYTQQSTVGFQYEISPNMAFSADFVHMLGLNFLMTRNVNSALPLDQTGGSRVCPFGTALAARGFDPCFQMRVGHDMSDRIHVNSLSLQLNRRFSGRFAFLAGYTLGSVNQFNVGGFPIIIGVQPSDAHNKHADINFGAAENDVRHRLTANLVYELPAGVSVSSIVTANSAPPYDHTTGLDNNLDFIRNDRPAGVHPNALRGETYFNTDLRLSKRFFFDEIRNVEVLWEMFNLFNTANLVNFNGNQLASTFGKGRAALAPFQAQLGLRFAF